LKSTKKRKKQRSYLEKIAISKNGSHEKKQNSFRSTSEKAVSFKVSVKIEVQ
jgi:hypothetical protein